MSELIVNPSEYGIEDNKANELIGNLPQIKNERNAFVSQYDEVIKMDIEDPNTSKTAKALRLKIKDNRTKGIVVWHKNTKEVFLRAGQFIDAVKRQEEAVNIRMEEALEEIEKYAEIQEKLRIDNLRTERISLVEDVKEFIPISIDLGVISEDDFNNLLNGAKLQLQAKIEAEKRAEQERLEAERKAKEEAERIEKDREAERLRIEAENKRLADEKAKLEIEAERQRKEAEELLARERKIQQEKLEKERAERAKIEAELKAKREAEEKAERERIEAERIAKREAERLAKAPIKKQLKIWVESFELPKSTIENEKVLDIQEKFSSFKNWALNQIENI